MKRCARCRLKKPVVDFGRDRSRKDGRFPWCLECKATNQRAWRTGARKMRDNMNHRLAYWSDPERYKASVYVNRAVRTGRLKKAEACEDCGATDRRLDGHHHRGYSKHHRLDVVWLCRSCHQVRHRRDATPVQIAA